jgi:tetraacyldisaccharide 4'-kinase
MRTPAFWYRPPSAAARLLDPIGRLYGLAGRARFALSTAERAGAPVLCVGNLVAGGAGKTPVALALAERLGPRAVHFVTRGHGGRERGPCRVDPARHAAADVGDEALLLARARPTWVARDRAAGARAAVAAGAEAIVLDDGFQNPGLGKDLSLVVVDGAVGFGNGMLVPAGPLREPVRRGLARAHVLVLLGEDRSGARAALAGGPPVLGARLEPTPEALAMRGLRAVAFAGIGRPEKFFDTCRGIGIELAETIAFPDHHPYGPADLARVEAAAERLGAVPLTTEKDLVRLPDALRARVRAVPVRVAWDDEAALDAILAPLRTRLGARHGA